MSDNREVARDLLIEAGRTILKDRPGIHGSAENSFEMIGDLWTVYLRHMRRTRGTDTVRGEDVAEMMTMLKKARKMYGDATNRDNDIDDIGYAALAGMLRLPDPADERSLDQKLASGLKVDEDPAPVRATGKQPDEAPRKELKLDEAGFLGTKEPERPDERSPAEILRSLYGMNQQPKNEE